MHISMIYMLRLICAPLLFWNWSTPPSKISIFSVLAMHTSQTYQNALCQEIKLCLTTTYSELFSLCFAKKWAWNMLNGKSIHMFKMIEFKNKNLASRQGTQNQAPSLNALLTRERVLNCCFLSIFCATSSSWRFSVIFSFNHHKHL